MAKVVTFNELRQLKDSLPDGSMHQIAQRLGLNVETVRNYFGGANYEKGEAVGVHIEQGPDGGLVHLEDTLIWDMACTILKELESKAE